VEHDDAAYVSEECRRYWEARDPLKLFLSYLKEKSGVSPEKIEGVDKECAVVVDEAVRYAEELPLPRAETVSDRLFAPR
jgi:pyruvate dehydrogenase E1 component alpha subunit